MSIGIFQTAACCPLRLPESTCRIRPFAVQLYGLASVPKVSALGQRNRYVFFLIDLGPVVFLALSPAFFPARFEHPLLEDLFPHLPCQRKGFAPPYPSSFLQPCRYFSIETIWAYRGP